MNINFNIPECTIQHDYQYTNDILQEGKLFPVLSIGCDSYIGDACTDYIPDRDLVYNLQIGRYSSLSGGINFIIDMNHDYKRACQGRISNSAYCRPEQIKRKGQIIIMNDCWIGKNAAILSGVTIGNGAIVAAGAVVTKDIPPYAIAAGNPAQIIGYRFEPAQIEALNLIRWWNWPTEKIQKNSADLYGDIDWFIQKHIHSAKEDLAAISPVPINPIEKTNQGESKTLFYIPDFEQDYPTYPKVIEAFARSYSDTNCELLLYICEDDSLDDKLSALNAVFARYEEVNCYINLHIGNIDDLRRLFCQVDAYITNRSKDNVYHMDLADLFGIPVISSVDIPVFERNQNIRHMISVKQNTAPIPESKPDNSNLRTLIQTIRTLSDTQEQIQATISQLSVNQLALDRSIDNLKWEFLSTDSKPFYPVIESPEKTVQLIIDEGKSICRFGDGEFAIMSGINRQKFQDTNPVLAARLREILHSDRENILIAIANIYGDLSHYSEDGKYNIRIYLTEAVRKQHYALLEENRVYYDAHMSRPYALYADNHTDAPRVRFNQLKKIWESRKLLIIEGEKTRMGIGNDLFANASDIIRILGPAEQAFNRYDDILEEALKQDKDRLVLIALGATATVLAYDLACAGFQALDIGHIDLEYEWMLAGTGKKTAVAHKYNNEFPSGDNVEELNDPLYEKQIIARFA
ncbi:MAG: GT-D fold domain-containing glycosyltransferase [Bacteroidales bacterium]|nr:GT-D fold domain-containing glycosyltransferase [Clostridium sp.]MCM1204385.1 GT-D fold domain-containing glycosyltransferase [Bacteroidales bacterium]